MAKKTHFKATMAAGLAFVLLLAGCSGPAVETDAPVSLGTAVEVQQLKRSTIINELTYIGQIEAQSQVSVASKVSAEVKDIYFDIGDTVQAGDVLFTVDGADIQDQIRQLQASAALSEISVKQAEYGLEIAQEGSAQDNLNEINYLNGIYTSRYGTQSSQLNRDSAKDKIDAAESEADSAWATYKAELAYLEEMNTIGIGGFIDGDEVTEASLNTQTKLVEKALGSYYAADAAITAAENTYDASRITDNQSDKSLDLAYDSYDAYKEYSQESKERSIQQAQFGVQTAVASQNATQVQLEIAQSTLGDTQVKSPISGVISERAIEVGQRISSATLPFTIVSMDVVNVKVSVSESLINSVTPGDEATVSIQAIGNTPVRGMVTAVSPAAGSNSTYPVRVQLDNTDGKIKPGMFSQVSFVQSQKEDTFVVDKTVVLRDEISSYIYIVKDGAAKRVTITTGMSNGSEIEIVSGVSVGDDIVVVGQEYLHNGDMVNVVKRDGIAVTADAGEVPAAEEESSPPDESSVEEEASGPDAQAEQETQEKTPVEPEPAPVTVPQQPARVEPVRTVAQEDTAQDSAAGGAAEAQDQKAEPEPAIPSLFDRLKDE